MTYNVGALQGYFWFPVSGGIVVNSPTAATGTGSVAGTEWLLAKSFTDANNFWNADPISSYVGDPVLDYWDGETQAAWAGGGFGVYYVQRGLTPPLNLTTLLFQDYETTNTEHGELATDRGFPGAYAPFVNILLTNGLYVPPIYHPTPECHGEPC